MPILRYRFFITEKIMEDRIDIHAGTIQHETKHSASIQADKESEEKKLSNLWPSLGSFLGGLLGFNSAIGKTQLTTEQRLALEAAEAERRRRQTFLVAGIVVALLLIMGAVAFAKK